MSFLGTTISRYGYEELTPQLSSPPSFDHWFGTDAIGHDLFARVVRGARRSLLVAMVVAALATAIGATVGALAGYYRGLLDLSLMRVTDLFLTIPALSS